MGGPNTKARKVIRNHVLSEDEVLHLLQAHPEGATSVQIENILKGTHGYQLLFDLQARGKVHQIGFAQGTGTRKYPPTWALGPAPGGKA